MLAGLPPPSPKKKGASPAIALERTYSSVADLLSAGELFVAKKTPPKSPPRQAPNAAELTTSRSGLDPLAEASLPIDAIGSHAASSRPKRKKSKRRKLKRRALPPLLATGNPVVRITAEASVLRPPRPTYGYVSISGSFRDHFTVGGFNKPADRLLICDNFLGCNEQSLFGCAEGIGMHGGRVAEFLITALPGLIEAVAIEHSRRRRAAAAKGGKAHTAGEKDPQARTAAAVRGIMALLEDEDAAGDVGPTLPGVHTPSKGHGHSRGGDKDKGKDADSNGKDKDKAPKKKLVERLAEVAGDVVSRAHTMLSRGKDRDKEKDKDKADAVGGAAGSASSPLSLVDPPEAKFNGASLCFALLRGSDLIIANVGGCRAVIGCDVDAVAVAAMLPDAPAAPRGAQPQSSRRGYGVSAFSSTARSASAGGSGGGGGGLTTIGAPGGSLQLMGSSEMLPLDGGGSSSLATPHSASGVMRQSSAGGVSTGRSGTGGHAQGGSAAGGGAGGKGNSSHAGARALRLLHDVAVVDAGLLRAPGAVAVLATHGSGALRSAADAGAPPPSAGAGTGTGTGTGTGGGLGSSSSLALHDSTAARAIAAKGSTTLAEAEARKRAVLQPASTADFPALPPVVAEALWFPESTYVEPAKALALHRAAAVQARRAEVASRITRIAVRAAASFAVTSQVSTFAGALPTPHPFLAVLPPQVVADEGVKTGLIAPAANGLDDAGRGSLSPPGSPKLSGRGSPGPGLHRGSSSRSLRLPALTLKLADGSGQGGGGSNSGSRSGSRNASRSPTREKRRVSAAGGGSSLHPALKRGQSSSNLTDSDPGTAATGPGEQGRSRSGSAGGGGVAGNFSAKGAGFTASVTFRTVSIEGEGEGEGEGGQGDGVSTGALGGPQWMSGSMSGSAQARLAATSTAAPGSLSVGLGGSLLDASSWNALSVLERVRAHELPAPDGVAPVSPAAAAAKAAAGSATGSGAAGGPAAARGQGQGHGPSLGFTSPSRSQSHAQVTAGSSAAAAAAAAAAAGSSAAASSVPATPAPVLACKPPLPTPAHSTGLGHSQSAPQAALGPIAGAPGAALLRVKPQLQAAAGAGGSSPSSSPAAAGALTLRLPGRGAGAAPSPAGTAGSALASPLRPQQSALTAAAQATVTPEAQSILSAARLPMRALRGPGAVLGGTSAAMAVARGDGSGVGGPVGDAVKMLQTLVASPHAVDFSVPPPEHADGPLAAEVRQRYRLLYKHQAQLAGNGSTIGSTGATADDGSSSRGGSASTSGSALRLHSPLPSRATRGSLSLSLGTALGSASSAAADGGFRVNSPPASPSRLQAASFVSASSSPPDGSPRGPHRSPPRASILSIASSGIARERGDSLAHSPPGEGTDEGDDGAGEQSADAAAAAAAGASHPASAAGRHPTHPVEAALAAALGEEYAGHEAPLNPARGMLRTPKAAQHISSFGAAIRGEMAADMSVVAATAAAAQALVAPPAEEAAAFASRRKEAAAEFARSHHAAAMRAQNRRGSTSAVDDPASATTAAADLAALLFTGEGSSPSPSEGAEAGSQADLAAASAAAPVMRVQGYGEALAAAAAAAALPSPGAGSALSAATSSLSKSKGKGKGRSSPTGATSAAALPPQLPPQEGLQVPIPDAFDLHALEAAVSGRRPMASPSPSLALTMSAVDANGFASFGGDSGRGSPLHLHRDHSGAGAVSPSLSVSPSASPVALTGKAHPAQLAMLSPRVDHGADEGVNVQAGADADGHGGGLAEPAAALFGRRPLAMTAMAAGAPTSSRAHSARTAAGASSVPLQGSAPAVAPAVAASPSPALVHGLEQFVGLDSVTEAGSELQMVAQPANASGHGSRGSSRNRRPSSSGSRGSDTDHNRVGGLQTGTGTGTGMDTGMHMGSAGSSMSTMHLSMVTPAASMASEMAQGLLLAPHAHRVPLHDAGASGIASSSSSSSASLAAGFTSYALVPPSGSSGVEGGNSALSRSLGAGLKGLAQRQRAAQDALLIAQSAEWAMQGEAIQAQDAAAAAAAIAAAGPSTPQRQQHMLSSSSAATSIAGAASSSSFAGHNAAAVAQAFLSLGPVMPSGPIADPLGSVYRNAGRHTEERGQFGRKDHGAGAGAGHAYSDGEGSHPHQHPLSQSQLQLALYRQEGNTALGASISIGAGVGAGGTGTGAGAARPSFSGLGSRHGVSSPAAWGDTRGPGSPRSPRSPGSPGSRASRSRSRRGGRRSPGNGSGSGSDSEGGYGDGRDGEGAGGAPVPAFLEDIRYYDDAGRPLRMFIPLVLTVDHRPDRPEEAGRILAFGGRIGLGQFDGGRRGNLPRVFGPAHDGPGLAVSRCVGFTSASPLGVSAAPDVIIHKLAPNDRFLILASDGLWAVLSSDEAVAIVGRTIESVLWGGRADPKLLAAERDRDKAAAAAAAAATARTDAAAPAAEASTSTSTPRAAAPAADALALDIAPTPSSAWLPGGPGDTTSFALTVASPRGLASSSSSSSSSAAAAALGLGSTSVPQALSVLAPEDAALVAAAGALDPRTTGLQRSLSAPVAHPAPLKHVAPSPSVETRVIVSAGAAPAAGLGGGTALPMDLAESVVPAPVRLARLQRRRTTSLAAAEALVAAARAKWREQAGVAGSGDGDALSHGASPSTASEAPWDDISVLVVIFE